MGIIIVWVSDAHMPPRQSTITASRGPRVVAVVSGTDAPYR
jgi:hypothetical protein